MQRRPMLATAGVMSLILSAGATTMLVGGCRDTTPPPQRVPIPSAHESDRQQSTRVEREDDGAPPPPARERYAGHEQIKPLPPQNHGEDPGPPFDDVPLLSQRPPEQAAFVDAYRRVGSPKMVVFVSHTLASGQADEANAKSVDYGAIENIMTDWLASNGNVTILSPTSVQARQTGSLSQGAQLGADIVVQVQAQPTRQTQDGSGIRMVAEAMNTKGGQSIGRAVVDVPPPLEKTTINKYTRYLARKLMDDMTQTWQAPPPPDHDAGPREAPAAAAPAIAPSTQPENR